MEARLQFGPGDSVGFTPAGIAAFSDLRPAAVVRELVQNAVDAASEADQHTAVVRFCLDTMPADDIPDIERYEEAFDAAIEMQQQLAGGELPAKAQFVVDTIDKALSEEEQLVLAVLDNGIGLDDRRMTALLSDGVSSKGDTASGTFGNGHNVAIPASDLRYLLYGGVLKNGDSICAGHAVLASHTSIDDTSDHPSSGDGFFIRRFRSGRKGRLYEFARDDLIPDLIRRYLDDIQEVSRHGSAVIIPAFNKFRQTKSLWDMVAEGTACNFFQAVAEERLVVHVEDHTTRGLVDTQTLNSRNIQAVLSDYRDNRRSKAFLSGEKAYSAYQVLKRGVSHSSVETSYGPLRICLLNKSTGTPRVDLCRNGMWITDNKKFPGLPGFRNKFGDQQPFHALLLLDSSDTELYRLVRKAEGPLHDKLDLKSMRSEDRRNIRRAFAQIREWLLANTDEVDDTSFSPDDFLVLDFGDSDDGLWGTPEVVGRRAPERNPVRTKSQPGGQHKSTGKVSPVGRTRPPRVAPFFSAVSVPVSSDRRRIEIACRRECARAMLELSVHENIDPTCDRIARDRAGEVILSDVLVDDVPVDQSQLVIRDDSVVGVRLGDLGKGQSVSVEVSCSLPGYFASIGVSSACLLVDVGPEPQEASDS